MVMIAYLLLSDKTHNRNLTLRQNSELLELVLHLELLLHLRNEVLLLRNWFALLSWFAFAYL